MKVNLVAVQAKPELDDYRDAAAFRRKMTSLMERAMAAADPSCRTLVAFPEGIALFLSFVPYYWDDVRAAESLAAAMGRVLSREKLDGPGGQEAAIEVGFRRHALETEAAYVETFASLSKAHGAYVSAGSIYTPPIDTEAGKGRHLTSDCVYNTSYLFSPQGVCLARTPKVNLVPPLESVAGFSGGSPHDLLPVETAVGRLGTLICYDGFFESLVARYDALGVEIILKPSYNQRAWEEEWSHGRGLREGEAWLKYGLARLIQGRENVRYGVNAMMVGRVLDVEAEGRSSISVNSGDPATPGEDALLAIAARPDEETVVAATVELPDRESRPLAVTANP